ncbi:DUF3341 domain-containing protein [Marinobacter fonticola]|uniref:DUF3341 domain-containing protein n=1 Tax=Marinobacter fonticola TaxID=2603215 RepID=UPI0011E7019C|nr:DUF3341 domain-containing protein [Marinobacter fonticola]
MSDAPVFGILVRLPSAEALLAASKAARKAGFRDLDAFSPFPVPDLAETLGYRERLIPVLSLVLGLIAAAGAFFMQWYAAFDYPYVVGGKPLNSWPAFLPITFEVGVLASVLTALLTMLIRNGLPQPYHPVFNDPDFDAASSDGFFLVLPGAALAEVQACLEDHDTGVIRELAL